MIRKTEFSLESFLSTSPCRWNISFSQCLIFEKSIQALPCVDNTSLGQIGTLNTPFSAAREPETSCLGPTLGAWQRTHRTRFMKRRPRTLKASLELNHSCRVTNLSLSLLVCHYPSVFRCTVHLSNRSDLTCRKVTRRIYGLQSTRENKYNHVL